MAALESAARFHWAGSERPVSSYLTPKVDLKDTCEFVNFFDHLLVLFL